MTTLNITPILNSAHVSVKADIASYQQQESTGVGLCWTGVKDVIRDLAREEGPLKVK